MKIEILYFEMCPNYQVTLETVREALAEAGLTAEIRTVRIGTHEEAVAHQFIGSPSVRINGNDIDPEARQRTDYALACRLYKDGATLSKERLIGAFVEERSREERSLKGSN